MKHLTLAVLLAACILYGTLSVSALVRHDDGKPDATVAPAPGSGVTVIAYVGVE